MPIVSLYQNRFPIVVDKLRRLETYGEYSRMGNIEVVNLEVVNVTIEKLCHEFFGRIPYVISDYKNIDYKKPLPPELVIAKLTCCKPIRMGNGSSLLLAWFQQQGESCFKNARKHFRHIKWEEKAQDFCVDDIIDMRYKGRIRVQKVIDLNGRHFLVMDGKIVKKLKY